MTRPLALHLAVLAAITLPLAATATPDQPEPARPMIAGGWSPIPAPAADPEVRAAARAALTRLPHHARLRRIESAERQVVAGMNYRLVLRLSNGQRWSATVWRKLDGVMVVSGVERER
ncbi:cystatin domain-containing protein [Novosphingobium sp.]|uniref:cystatin domain-containing protein n=1 Tax=Novosphingobium sp. TaxID=1874826 RepID=UPI0025EC5A18|nr:cystatin domain-containing protein [Novosphingobium sp.]